MRYYSTQRPVTPGSFPRAGEQESVRNFENRTYCEEIGREAWGYVEYKGTLTDEEVKRYELTPAGRKLWYEVTVAVYQNGQTRAILSRTVEASEKPACRSKITKTGEVRTNWYDIRAEADEAVRKASSEKQSV